MLRADGVVLPLPRLRYNFPDYPANPYGYTTCRDYAGDLSDQRVALATSATLANPSFRSASVRFDVATGRVVDSLSGAYQLLNDAGQLAGSSTPSGGGPANTYASARGFTMPSVPSGPRPYCNSRPGGGPSGDYGSVEVLNLDESANVLVNLDRCSTYAYLSAAGSVVLDRYLARGAWTRSAP